MVKRLFYPKIIAIPTYKNGRKVCFHCGKPIDKGRREQYQNVCFYASCWIKRKNNEIKLEPKVAKWIKEFYDN